MPSSRPARIDHEMSVQERETTHVPVAHPSASETIPSDVLATPVELEDSAQTTSVRRISFKRPPNPIDRVESPKRTRGTLMFILHSFLLIIIIWSECLKI